MAPEEPADIVVLDLAIVNGKLTGTVDAIERTHEARQANERLRVLWNAIQPPSGFRAIRGGVVYVGERQMATPPLTYPAAPTDLGEDGYSWRYATLEPIMVVIVLPRTYEVVDCVPNPSGAKATADGRLAVYWLFDGSANDDDAEFSWVIKKVENVEAAAQLINRHAARSKEITSVDLTLRATPAAMDPSFNEMVHRPPSSAVHMRAGNPVMLIIVIVVGFFGCYAVYAGIQLMGTQGSGETIFEVIGLKFTTKHAGVASIGIGAIVVLLSIRRVLKALENLARL